MTLNSITPPKKRQTYDKIVVDPRFDIRYLSYYLKGLTELFPKAKVIWKVFPELTINGEHNEFYRYLVCQLVNRSGEVKRVVVAAKDNNQIDQQYYDWCDVYGLINLRPEDVHLSKIVAVGPGFGIRLWGTAKTVIMGLANYNKSKGYIDKPFKRFILDYLYLPARRLALQDYEQCGLEDNDYVYSLNTLWYGEFEMKYTNKFRGAFLKACQAIYPKFEGGFFYIDSVSDASVPGYSNYLTEWKDFIVHRRIPMAEYMEKLRKSALVFNTPSVDMCHGWKIGEYLAMGKVIISTPFINVMPEDFQNGLQYVEVSSEKDIYRVVEELRQDSKRCEELKRQARDFYNHVCSPSAAMSRVLGHD